LSGTITKKQKPEQYRKHGISFGTATKVFQDPNFVMLEDREIESEERWHTIGRVGGVTLLIVAHMYEDEEYGGEIVRIISARAVTPQERRIYEANAY
jgi:uncharacterized protein